jgi:hypothetical protein
MADLSESISYMGYILHGIGHSPAKDFFGFLVDGFMIDIVYCLSDNYRLNSLSCFELKHDLENPFSIESIIRSFHFDVDQIDLHTKLFSERVLVVDQECRFIAFSDFNDFQIVLLHRETVKNSLSLISFLNNIKIDLQEVAKFSSTAEHHNRLVVDRISLINKPYG